MFALLTFEKMAAYCGAAVWWRGSVYSIRVEACRGDLKY